MRTQDLIDRLRAESRDLALQGGGGDLFGVVAALSHMRKALDGLADAIQSEGVADARSLALDGVVRALPRGFDARFWRRDDGSIGLNVEPKAGVPRNPLGPPALIDERDRLLAALLDKSRAYEDLKLQWNAREDHQVRCNRELLEETARRDVERTAQAEALALALHDRDEARQALADGDARRGRLAADVERLRIELQERPAELGAAIQQVAQSLPGHALSLTLRPLPTFRSLVAAGTCGGED